MLSRTRDNYYIVVVNRSSDRLTANQWVTANSFSPHHTRRRQLQPLIAQQPPGLITSNLVVCQWRCTSSNLPAQIPRFRLADKKLASMPRRVVDPDHEKRITNARREMDDNLALSLRRAAMTNNVKYRTL